MKNILITGATGNIGFEVIRYLFQHETQNTIIAGVRNIDKAQNVFGDFQQLEFRHFDFEDFSTFDEALTGIDCVFLMRPPHISDVHKFFKPLIDSMLDNKISEIVFLSVQGAEKSKVIPHNKIERLIIESKIEYIFLRPSYFMQNLTTTLLTDIKEKRQILLPAGCAKFNWVDIENIGEVSAILLDKFDEYRNQIFEITGYENANFEKVVSLINEEIENPIQFVNTNPLKFYSIKKHEKMETAMIFVMILLHFLPRFQKEPEISNFYETLTGNKPTNLKQFIKSKLNKFG